MNDDEDFFLTIPTALPEHLSEMENCFKSYCLIVSTILGKFWNSQRFIPKLGI